MNITSSRPAPKARSALPCLPVRLPDWSHTIIGRVAWSPENGFPFCNCDYATSRISGAVSPATRATDSSAEVMSSDIAVGSTIFSTVRHFGPSA